MSAPAENNPADPSDHGPLTGTVVSDANAPSTPDPIATDARALEQELRAMPGVVAVRTTTAAVQVALDPTVAAAVSTQAVIDVIRRLAPECATVEVAHRDPRA